MEGRYGLNFYRTYRIKNSLDYVCQHCHEMVRAAYDDFVSNATVLRCPRCEGVTHVQLDRPVDYEAKERVRNENDGGVHSR